MGHFWVLVNPTNHCSASTLREVGGTKGRWGWSSCSYFHRESKGRGRNAHVYRCGFPRVAPGSSAISAGKAHGSPCQSRRYGQWRRGRPRPKIIAKQLERDGGLILQLVVAEKLGYTLLELQERITPEELWIWSAFFELRHQKEQAALNSAKRGRR